MYINPNSVGMKFELLKRSFKDALETECYSKAERKLISDALDSLEYIRGFFAGTSKLPTLEEDASTTWGMTFDWLKNSYKKVEEAEQLINQVMQLQELALTNASRNAEQQKSAESLDKIPGLSFHDVPSFTPNPKVRAQILDLMEGWGEGDATSEVQTAGDIAEKDAAADEQSTLEALEYGLGM